MTWVDVNENLPESFVDVLVWDSREEKCYIGNLTISKGFWIVGSPQTDRCVKKTHVDITYWAPVPKAPGEKKYAKHK